MWSGPRNISTAMMRAWENRSDCVVIDEPFYPHYLEHTGIDHPMAADIVAHYPTDLASALKRVSTVPESGLVYQKQITTHMLDHVPLDWIAHVANLFLIRHPAFMVASYSAKRASLTPDDLGYPSLEHIFEKARSISETQPLVIDSTQFLNKPGSYLQYICSHLGVEFDESMLSWPPGERDSDGIWHAHWYESVKRSSGFGKARSAMPELTHDQQAVANACMPHYTALNKHALVL